MDDIKGAAENSLPLLTLGGRFLTWAVLLGRPFSGCKVRYCEGELGYRGWRDFA